MTASQRSNTEDDDRPGEVRVDRLLGQRVRAGNNQSIGRLEEFRVEQRGTSFVVTQFVIGGAGLLERLGLGVRLLVGRPRKSYLAEWDQLDISDPEQPRLKCSTNELQPYDGRGD